MALFECLPGFLNAAGCHVLVGLQELSIYSYLEVEQCLFSFEPLVYHESEAVDLAHA